MDALGAGRYGWPEGIEMDHHAQLRLKTLILLLPVAVILTACGLGSSSPPTNSAKSADAPATPASRAAKRLVLAGFRRTNHAKSLHMMASMHISGMGANGSTDRVKIASSLAGDFMLGSRTPRVRLRGTQLQSDVTSLPIVGRHVSGSTVRWHLVVVGRRLEQRRGASAWTCGRAHKESPESATDISLAGVERSPARHFAPATDILYHGRAAWKVVLRSHISPHGLARERVPVRWTFVMTRKRDALLEVVERWSAPKEPSLGTFMQVARFSHYGEHVKIKLPAACRKG